jgi:prepilin-type N-terminal cleavage/methylation domain-containing protein
MKNKGFTLIELLIVIAILATLAVVVLLALDPVQQLARTRDSGHSSTVTQLGHAMEAYAAARNGEYPTNGGAGSCASAGAWITNCLVNSGEIKIVPSSSYPSGATLCTGGVTEGSICYLGTTSAFTIYATAEAKANKSMCGSATANAWFAYSSTSGRGGVTCTQPAAAGTVTFVN